MESKSEKSKGRGENQKSTKQIKEDDNSKKRILARRITYPSRNNDSDISGTIHLKKWLNTKQLISAMPAEKKAHTAKSAGAT